MSTPLRTRRASNQFDIDGGEFDKSQNHRPLRSGKAVAATILAVGLVVAGFMVGGHYTIEAATPCDRVADDIALVGRLTGDGQFDQASVLAHTDLRRSRLCPGVPLVLARAAYRADIDSLLTAPHVPGDIVGEEHVIQRWADTVRFARQYHISAESPAELEPLAYGLGYWDFARVLWLQTVHDSQADRNHFYSVLVNDGRELAVAAASQFRARGLALLVLAHDLGQLWSLPRREADQTLRSEVGPNIQRWPAPFPCTLLSAHHRERRSGTTARVRPHIRSRE